MKFNKKTYLQK